MHGSEGLEGTTRPQKSIKPTRIAATIERKGPTSSRTTFRRDAQRQEDHVTPARSFASPARTPRTNESKSKSKSKSISRLTPLNLR